MSFPKQFRHLLMSLEAIEEATKNFTTNIGSGGYGPVYKGDLPSSGVTIAVKRLPKVSLHGQGLKEFFTELDLLWRYRHPNIVSLIGYCHEENEKLLIYLYAEHKSLDNYLKTASCPLTWIQRIKICIDAARGLAHCHHGLGNTSIIHRDIKSANILLDENMKAVLGDFGLSILGRANESRALLKVSGTRGYSDPEYIKTGILTTKSDVYSFGVVVFELLCGRLCFIDVIGEQRHLVPLVRRCYQEGKLNQIIDPALKDTESVKVVYEIAYQCLQDDPQERPSMELVVQRLEKALSLLDLDEASESQGFREPQTSLPSEDFAVHNEQQWIDQVLSEGSTGAPQRTTINQIQRNVNHGLGQTDGFVGDGKLPSEGSVRPIQRNSANQKQRILYPGSSHGSVDDGKLPSEGYMRPIQRTSINQLERTVVHGSGPADASIDDGNLPSEGSMRPIQRTMINQIETDVYQGLGQTDGSVGDGKLPTYTRYPHAISYNQDGIIISEYDPSGQSPSVGVMANTRFSNPSDVEDPYYGDIEPELYNVIKPQPFQIGGSFTDIQNSPPDV